MPGHDLGRVLRYLVFGVDLLPQYFDDSAIGEWTKGPISPFCSLCSGVNWSTWVLGPFLETEIQFPFFRFMDRGGFVPKFSCIPFGFSCAISSMVNNEIN